MVKLKWGMEYKGYLVSVDGYMNMQVSWRVIKIIKLYLFFFPWLLRFSVTYKDTIRITDKHKAKFRNKVKAREDAVTVITMCEIGHRFPS